MDIEEDSIEQAAAVRRERLGALKAAQQLLDTPDDGSAQSEPRTDIQPENGKENNPSMKFRNYVPQDKELHEGKIAPPVLPKFEEPVAIEPPPLEKKEDPFLDIAAKKPNWDLRRDVQKKLDKLERRTQKAIYKLREEQEKEKLLAGDGGDVEE
ncbi:hypothetical protein K2173_020917 [Erythroxylum novogranatense]|uniref:Coiled-coil domain-containing protein 12 n=1 Tax=Erythroxylum novogranatense TaxID=1862640 RepID=A0AAV8TM08_9ROSI|nr:hypothetical protein K2173_020917 [Erythroxylum novogranatense]